MKLRELLCGIEVLEVHADLETEISGVSYDSRQTKSGDLFAAIAGYETVNWGKTLLSDGATLHNSDTFIYGGAVNIQADFYLSDRIALIANVKERFIFGNSTGHFRFQWGAGIRIMID